MSSQFQVISFGESAPKVREQKKRKFHVKTRAGCIGCKTKRVKVGSSCDESRPACRRCVRNSRPCLYDTTGLTSARPTRSPGEGSDASSDPDLVLVPSPRRLSAHSTVQAVLPVDCATKFGGTPAGVLLEFFNEHHEHMLSGAPLGTVWDMACRYPHLLTGILSASACFLRHHSTNPAPHRVAEIYQQSLTVRSFQASLEAPLTKERSDALLMTCIFLNLLAMTDLHDDDPATSWVFSSDPGRLGWINILLGFRPLFMVSLHFMRQSILLPLYEKSDGPLKEAAGDEMFTIPLPQAWERFKALDPRDGDILDEAIHALYATRFIPAEMENVNAYMQFFGRLETPFRDMLLRGDERAMWMFGYWLGLLGRLDAWFTRRRVVRDYTAIVMWLLGLALDEREGDEGDMWRELLVDLQGLRVDWHPSNLGTSTAGNTASA
ncbi:hypothetical protein F5X68DRAFT_233341 [Plectosphaerella plurivora]|uniref:Zn(2)-C6 fungal-type domain-containing protein n=1 Tax=Plectosphaerella plurivora TaxID=936078 RepID=A0A9P9AA72_9PEZI|nr:hypothetical protein F5X68DRAFT_233341 [Plectosphaerella plurivora]